MFEKKFEIVQVQNMEKIVRSRLIYDSLKEKMTELFGMDVRSIGLFRILFALIFFYDTFDRWTNLTAHYTDFGGFPRSVAYAMSPNNQLWLSPYFYSGSAWWVNFLFTLNIIFIFGLLIGYRTRAMVCINWFFMVSIQDRNILVGHGGDVLERVLLLWSVFVPLGIIWSVDSLAAKNPLPKRILSFGTAGLLLQICMVYWFSVLFKWNESWFSGQAVYYALNIEQFAKPFGMWLSQYKTILPYITWTVLFTEGVLPIFAFCPFFTGPIRTFVVFAFMLLHLIFGISLQIGNFSLIGIAMWTAFLPSWFWDNVVGRLPLKEWYEKIGIDSYVQKLKARLKPRTLVWKYSKTEAILAILLFAYIVFYNFYVTMGPFKSTPKSLLKIGAFLHIEERWGMFSRPMTADGWYVIPGKLVSGKMIDVYTGQDLTWEKPEYVTYQYPDTRWIKFMQYFWLDQFKDHRLFYSQYLCRKWNSEHSGLDMLDTFQIYFVLNPINPDSKGPTQKFLLWTHYCLAPTTDKPLDQLPQGLK